MLPPSSVSNCGEKEIGVPVGGRTKRGGVGIHEEEGGEEDTVEVKGGEAVVWSDGFVFLHNGGAKRPQAVGLWGVFPSSARDVLPCKCYCY